MYQTTMAGGLNVAAPDARKQAGGLASPQTDVSNAALAHPSTVALNVLADGMPTVHHMTRIVRSLPVEEANDNGGSAAVGVASQERMGPSKYVRGSRTVFKEGAPAQRLSSVTGQNGVNMNCAGVTLTPSQTTVLVNS